ncbi:UNVERIFIED_CONTAM: Disease resistance protein RPP13 [Sesamum angustifolium]|uniref:Disease resistance protein RPP13 n=1 Tax=Sesamum angustifolium TaxID=2727405 RepID=A0AAW2Q9S8_9LAMI
MAFAALISLKYTIKKFVQSDFERVYEEGLMSILELLNTAAQAYSSSDSERLKDVGRKIRQVIRRLEDLFKESVIYFWEHEEEKEEINSYAQNLKEIKEELSTHSFCTQQLQHQPITQRVEIMRLAYEEVIKFLHQLFTWEDGNNVRVTAAMEREIREAAWRLEDVLESLQVSNQHWDRIAEKESSVITGADEEATKALYLSYKYLPHHLKACFLYMGVFPLDFEIHTSKVINLWCAEGFLERNSHKSLENIARECLRSLVFKSVVLLREPSSNGTIKTCKVHSVFWHLCNREAGKDEFFHIMNSNANQSIESQRRLCIHNIIRLMCLLQINILDIF